MKMFNYPNVDFGPRNGSQNGQFQALDVEAEEIHGGSIQSQQDGEDREWLDRYHLGFLLHFVGDDRSQIGQPALVKGNDPQSGT